MTKLSRLARWIGAGREDVEGRGSDRGDCPRCGSTIVKPPLTHLAQCHLCWNVGKDIIVHLHWSHESYEPPPWPESNPNSPHTFSKILKGAFKNAKEGRCKKCGRTILWKKRDNGKYFPPFDHDGARHSCIKDEE